jgi:Transglycosylase SLT domain
VIQRRSNPARTVPHLRHGARMMFMALGAVQTGSIAGLVTAAANRYGVDPGLALAVAQRESSLNPNAFNAKSGAAGVMQLEPGTAAQFGVTDPYNPVANVNAGVQYLASLLAKYGGDVSKAVAAYDWGPGNLNKAISANGDNWLAVAPAETQAYVAALTGITPADQAAASTGDSGGGVFQIDPQTGYLVPDPSGGWDAAVMDTTGPTTSEFLVLTGLGVGAYLLIRSLD